MTTYCVPQFVGVPGSSATYLDWWSGAPTVPISGDDMRFFPDDPDWKGAFSLSAGDGATSQMVFRALHGNNAGQRYLYLSWIVRVAAFPSGDPNPDDRLYFVLGDGANYLGFHIGVETTSSTSGPSTGLTRSITVYPVTRNPDNSFTQLPSVSTPVEVNNTGYIWVNDTTPGRALPIKWAFQVALPLGVAIGSPAITLPTTGSFQLWYELWKSLGSGLVPYHLPNLVDSTLPPPENNTAGSPISPIMIPGNLRFGHLLDLSVGTTGCTPGVRIESSNVGVRNVDPSDPPRTSQYQIRLDLGQLYPPNQASLGTDYNETYTPNTTLTQFQNILFARPTLPADFTDEQRSALRARFSLANWGSQYSVPTADSWRPIPGGESVNFDIPGGENHFRWPTAPDTYTTNLTRRINRYLNAVGHSMTPLADGSTVNPHQCLLVELLDVSATTSAIIFTKSSVHVNMNIARVSTFEDFAEISVAGMPPISQQPRDVYLYLQTFNMPQEVDDPQREHVPPKILQAIREAPLTIDDVAEQQPTYVVHAFHDTGRKFTLEDGRQVPVLEPQTSFGYVAVHEGPLYGWDARLYGAEKLPGYDNLYIIRVPNNGSKYVMVAIQARESADDQPLPETRVLPPEARDGCLMALIRWLETLGPLGRAVASLLRQLVLGST